MTATCAVLLTMVAGDVSAGPRPNYAWPTADKSQAQLADRIAPPSGFERVDVARGSFAEWLRHLPIKRDGAPVRLHTGRLKRDQGLHAAVVDIDVGRRDLQQCADAVMRLRAEFLFASGRKNDIRFHFTSGDEASFERWAAGWRPVVTGNKVRWQRRSVADPKLGYKSFRSYMDIIFTYAGTWSLAREMRPVTDTRNVAIGDVLIQGGFPGHAILVVDMAVHPSTGEKRVLLMQSYMPAQNMHVLKVPGARDDTPWYTLPRRGKILTPEWTFDAGDLKRFR